MCWCTGMETKFYTITPEMAAEWLTHNTTNYRILDKDTVKQYADDMKAGQWKRNGETIVFGRETGVLLDGQHRLHGIVESNTAIDVLVCFDADEVSVHDVGKSRTINSIFKAEHKSATPINIATGRIIVNGGICTRSRGKLNIKNYVDEHLDDIKKAESIVATCGALGKKAPCAAVVYCFIRNKEISETEMRSFFQILNSGITAGCTKDASSALVLRKQFAETKGGSFINQKRQFETVIKAINDFHSGVCRCRKYTDDTLYAERLVKEIQIIDKVA